MGCFNCLKFWNNVGKLDWIHLQRNSSNFLSKQTAKMFHLHGTFNCLFLKNNLAWQSKGKGVLKMQRFWYFVPFFTIYCTCSAVAYQRLFRKRFKGSRRVQVSYKHSLRLAKTLAMISWRIMRKVLSLFMTWG